MRTWITRCFWALLLIAPAAGAQDGHRHRGPHHVKLQYAGGIGYLSAGLGYQTRKGGLEGDLMYGYVPPSKGGVRIHSLTVKGTGYPTPSIHWKKLEVKPLGLGLLVNYTFGKQYFGFSPDNYPYDYYGHPTAFHAAVFLGGTATIKTGSRRLPRIGAYYELLAFDRQLLSWYNNQDALSFSDALTIAVGVKLQLREAGK